MKRRKNRPFSPSGLALRWLKRKCIWYVPHLCILQWHFCPCHWSFWQGNHLLCNWWDEGEDRLRWIISICCYVGCPGCSPEVKELGIIAVHIKHQATGGNRTKSPGQGSQLALRSLLAQEWRLGRLRMSHPSPLTALTRGVAVIAICEQDSSNYYCSLLNCHDVS